MEDHTKVKYALSLDLSSSCCGYAYGHDGNVLKYGKWVNKDYDKGHKHHGKSLYKFSRWLSRVIRGCEKPPEVVLIEQPFKGRNANTFMVLSKFVGVAEREIVRLLPEVDIVMVPPAAVKAALNVERGSSHTDRKKKMVKRINRLLGLNLKYHSNKNKSADDIADAIGVLLYYFKRLDG